MHENEEDSTNCAYCGNSMQLTRTVKFDEYKVTLLRQGPGRLAVTVEGTDQPVVLLNAGRSGYSTCGDHKNHASFLGKFTT